MSSSVKKITIQKKVQHKKLWVLLVCLLTLNSAAVRAESMYEVITFALKNHPAIEGALAAQEAARQDSKAERAQYYPELSASLAFGRVYQDNATSRGLSIERGAAYSGYGEGNIALRQMLFDGRVTQNRLDSAQANERASHFSLLEERSNVTLTVVQSYIEILKLRSALQLLSAQTGEIENYLQRIKDMVRQGMSDEAELQQAQDVAMVMDSFKAEYEGQLITAQAAYTEAVGQAVPRILDVPDSMHSYVELDLDEVIKKARSNHPLIRAAYMRSQAAKYVMEAEESGLFPNVSGELMHNKTDKRDVIGGESVDSRALVKMNWSFSTGGRQLSSIERKKAEYLESLNKLKEVKRAVERGIREAYARYLTFWRKAELSEKRVELNRNLLVTYKNQFESSRISQLALMRAQSQLFRAQLEANDNSFNLLAAQYDVLAARGEITKIIFASAQPAAQQ
ncbi:MAG: TolC family protein [Alphaproteobacteria bacterium]